MEKICTNAVYAPLKFTVALSPTFVLVWNVALDPGRIVGSKSHWPRNATSLSATGSVIAVAEGFGLDALAVGMEELGCGLK